MDTLGCATVVSDTIYNEGDMATAELGDAEAQQGAKRNHPGRQTKTSPQEAEEYPVREYIAGMAKELAQMARWDGDEFLAALLDIAVARAEGPRP